MNCASGWLFIRNVVVMAELAVILVRSSTDINGCCVWQLAGQKWDISKHLCVSSRILLLSQQFTILSKRLTSCRTRIDLLEGILSFVLFTVVFCCQTTHVAEYKQFDTVELVKVFWLACTLSVTCSLIFFLMWTALVWHSYWHG
jgi:hypothetical protein